MTSKRKSSEKKQKFVDELREITNKFSEYEIIEEEFERLSALCREKAEKGICYISIEYDKQHASGEDFILLKNKNKVINLKDLIKRLEEEELQVTFNNGFVSWMGLTISWKSLPFQMCEVKQIK